MCLLVGLSLLFTSGTASAQGTWTEVTNAGGVAVVDSAMAYDSRRGVIVLFGGSGSLYDMWEYDGVTWRQITGITLPEGRRFHDMVYDSKRGVIVMFGGLRTDTSLTATDTWEYDGTTWRKINVTGPSGRYGFRMSYDSDRGVTVLYGSYNFAEDDTWEYDGTTWRQAATTSVIGGRYIHAMAYDPVRKVTVLYGGWRYNSTPNETGSRDKTYTWNGSTWTEVSSGIPSKRENLRMVFDANWGKLVLFGGISGSATYWGETWVWDGQWSKLDTNVPAVLSQYMMAYDSRRARVVLHGGFEYQRGNSSKTFEFDSGYRPPGPDISVDAFSVTGGAKGRVGEARAVSVTVSNRGAITAESFALQLSDNQQAVDQMIVAPLAPNDVRSITMRYTPVVKGPHTLSVYADPDAVLTDTDRSNNGDEMAFVAQKAKKGVDLAISTIDIDPATATAPAATSVNVSFTIVNVGTADAGPFTYTVYLTAKKGKIGKKDTLVIEAQSEGLKKGEKLTIVKTVMPKKLKPLFWFDGFIDAGNVIAETNETNNHVIRQYRLLP